MNREDLPVYVDFDDVLCETALALTCLLQQEFGKSVAYEDIREFNLEISFGLTTAECHHLMDVAHQPEFLSALPEIPGAVGTIRRWAADGIPVAIVTGRPASTFEASREWLRRHGVPHKDLAFVDKYGRADRYPSDVHCVSREEFQALRFRAAVDDSPVAIELLAANPSHRILVFDRPWNRDLPETICPPGRFERCNGWRDVDRVVRASD